MRIHKQIHHPPTGRKLDGGEKHGTKHGNQTKSDSSGEFKCNFCPMTFSWKCILDRHVVAHTGEKHFSCDECSEKFKRKDGLKMHKIHKHSIPGQEFRPFSCHICQKNFKWKNNVTKHIKAVHENFRVNCPWCGNTFREKGDMNRHIFLKHPEHFVPQGGGTEENGEERGEGLFNHSGRGEGFYNPSGAIQERRNNNNILDGLVAGPSVRQVGLECGKERTNTGTVLPTNHSVQTVIDNLVPGLPQVLKAATHGIVHCTEIGSQSEVTSATPSNVTSLQSDILVRPGIFN